MLYYFCHLQNIEGFHTQRNMAAECNRHSLTASTCKISHTDLKWNKWIFEFEVICFLLCVVFGMLKHTWRVCHTSTAKADMISWVFRLAYFDLQQSEMICSFFNVNLFLYSPASNLSLVYCKFIFRHSQELHFARW